MAAQEEGVFYLTENIGAELVEANSRQGSFYLTENIGVELVETNSRQGSLYSDTNIGHAPTIAFQVQMPQGWGHPLSGISFEEVLNSGAAFTGNEENIIDP